MRRLGVGVVGLGWMGQAHSRSYRRLPALFPERTVDPELVVCADADAGRRTWATHGFGFRSATNDWRVVVDDAAVDIVVVTAPNMFHLEIVEAAAAAGKAVFCEKPVGGTPQHAVAADAAATAAGVVSGVGYNYRWAPMVQHAKALINDGRLGTITNYRGRFLSCYGADPAGVLSWRYLLDGGGYGVSSDLLSHTLDLAMFLCGPIAEVVGTGATFIADRPLGSGAGTHYDRGDADAPRGAVTNEDWFGAIARFAGGAVGTFEASRTMVGPESQNAFEIHGTGGSVAWNLERMNELQVYLADPGAADGPAGYAHVPTGSAHVPTGYAHVPTGSAHVPTGYATVFGGEEFGDHGAFVPGRANPIGFEDLITIEDYHFATAVAEGHPFDPGFAAAADYAAVQSALLASWRSRAWEPVRRDRASRF